MTAGRHLLWRCAGPGRPDDGLGAHQWRSRVLVAELGGGADRRDRLGCLQRKRRQAHRAGHARHRRRWRRFVVADNDHQQQYQLGRPGAGLGGVSVLGD